MMNDRITAARSSFLFVLALAITSPRAAFLGDLFNYCKDFDLVFR